MQKYLRYGLIGLLTYTSSKKFGNNLRNPNPSQSSANNAGIPSEIQHIPQIAEILSIFVLAMPSHKWIPRFIPAAFFLTGAGVFATALIENRSINCDCFGQNTDSRVTWKSVWRNLGLTALTYAAMGETTSKTAFLKDVSKLNNRAAQYTLMMLYALRSFDMRSRASDAETPLIALGQELPKVDVYQSRSGLPIPMDEVLATAKGRKTILMLSGTCHSCLEIRENLQKERHLRNTVIIVWKQDRKLELESKGPSAFVEEVYDLSGSLELAWGIRGFPTLIELNKDNEVYSSPIVGSTAIARNLNIAI